MCLELWSIILHTPVSAIKQFLTLARLKVASNRYAAKWSKNRHPLHVSLNISAAILSFKKLYALFGENFIDPPPPIFLFFATPSPIISYILKINSLANSSCWVTFLSYYNWTIQSKNGFRPTFRRLWSSFKVFCLIELRGCWSVEQSSVIMHPYMWVKIP